MDVLTVLISSKLSHSSKQLPSLSSSSSPSCQTIITITKISPIPSGAEIELFIVNVGSAKTAQAPSTRLLHLGLAYEPDWLLRLRKMVSMRELGCCNVVLLTAVNDANESTRHDFFIVMLTAGTIAPYTCNVGCSNLVHAIFCSDAENDTLNPKTQT